MSVFPRRFLGFYRVFGCFAATSDGNSETHYKKRFAKTVDKKSKTDFCRFLFYHVFWAFLGEGSSKTSLKKYRTMILPWFFFGL
jgi:hypothetical protein